MENLYTTTTASYSPSLPPPESDDISLFLHQILIHSSSSYSLMAHNGGIPLHSTSPSHTLPENPNPPIQSSLFSGSGRISATESSSPFNSFSGAALSSSGVYFPATATNVSCFSGGITDYDPDDCDWESEEGFEALVEEKSVPPRISLKRGRAAEFHNLSEKRRRSRINEKMKALQNLIPNSNKTDKASMLDEAIEYLKQLQIQVQMLTMRNGLSLYPMCLPEVVQQTQFSQMKMGFCEGNELLNMNPTGILPMNQELTTNDLFNIPNQRTNQAHHSINALSSVIDSGTSFARESSLHGHLRPSGLPTLSEEFSREDMLPQKLDVDHSEMKSLGHCAGIMHPRSSETGKHAPIGSGV